MAELTGTASSAQRVKPLFFVWISVYCCFLAFGGFTPTYFAPISVGSLREVTPLVHIHGFLFFGWTLMLLTQTWLTAHGKIANHRTLGLAGISLATAMAITGLIVSAQFNGGFIAGDEQSRGYQGLLNGWSAMAIFGTFFTLAIANIRRPEYHKRWIVLATCAILSAAVSRLYLPLFDFEPVPRWLVYLTVDSIIVACLINDWRVLGRPHIVTVIGGTVLLSSQMFRGFIGDTETWRTIADSLIRIGG